MASTDDPDIHRDLKLQLQSALKSIMRKYTLYVRHIRLSLRDKGVSVEDLRSDLLTMPAISQAEQELSLLSAHKAELKSAATLNDIFDLLVTEYASFFDYDIFQFIVETYHIDHGEEELKYPEQLKAYLYKHKLSEFIEINPLLKKYTAASTEFILKIDIDSTSKMSKISDLKTAIAGILGLNSATLQLIKIQDGCVVVTFLIPTPVAELIFNKQTVLTVKQEGQLQAMEVLWLKCNECTFNFATKILEHSDEVHQATRYVY